MSISVHEIHKPRQMAALFELQSRLYANDPAWVSPVEAIEIRRIRPFLEQGRLRVFLAEEHGQVVGSISTLRDQRLEADRGEAIAWFGFFETVDDPEIAGALIACAADAASAWGCDHLRGPRNLTRFEHMGLTVEGHERRPPFLQGHHPPSYEGLLEQQGLTPHHDVLAYHTPVVDERGLPRPLPEPLASKAASCALDGLEVQPTHRWRMRRDLVDAHTVLNAAYATVPDVSPMPRATFLALGRTYLTVSDPRLLQIARVHGQPVGFAATFPELNEAIAPMQGQLLPAGWLRGALAMRQIRTASFKLIGVIPELRGSGLHAVLIDSVLDGVRRAGYTRLEASVIDERNGPMRAVVEGAGMQIYRRYRLFETLV
ncbi:MAG TPA: hypothetical protein ENK18_00505 [Deltaproteobacteria bacterium]|nr:hypothetical protein [Deltaproteobacteria bacterium]